LSDLLALLLDEYGLDPTRGSMLGTLRAHVEARMTQLGLDDPNHSPNLAESKFIECVRSDPGERDRLIHAVTVRHSWFYRDPGQLDALLLRMQARHARSRNRPLEVWIAGCAGGEEAWTIAMLATDIGIELRLHATDLDAIALKFAQYGEYGAWSLRELPQRLQRFIEPTRESRWRITDELRALNIEFVQHNLCDPPLPGRFDVICCRNVLIYFKPERARAVVEGLRGSLRPEGELLLGAGDLLFQIDGRARSGAAATRSNAKPEPARRGASSLDAAPQRAQRVLSSNPPTHSEGSGPIGRSDHSGQLGNSDQSGPSGPSGSSGSSGPSEQSEQLRTAGRAVEIGDYEAALERLAVILDVDPLDAEAHLWSGIAQFGLGREQLAAEALRRARCLAPQLWPATLFAALTHERRGLWSAATRCWAELERAISASDAPQIDGTPVLLDALPGWRAEALALARQRISKHAADGKSHD
jgi:chemotaxis protein methyltransferase CheR